MRILNLLSGVGVAIVAAWLGVTTLAYAGEFACTVPAFSDTDCGFPKFTLRPGETFKAEVYSVKVDGKDETKPAIFILQDTNNDNAKLTDLTILAGQSSAWKNPNKETALIVQLRLNVKNNSKTVVNGRYDIIK